ncbi:hypothetical protein ACFW84_19845 [Streptomyces anulatus]
MTAGSPPIPPRAARRPLLPHGGIGYDLVFDGTGRVTGLTSLYRP